VKLLLDENLSPRLIPGLLSLFEDLTHVRDIGLQRSDDAAIWEWAKWNGYTIVTTDSDFVSLNQRLGWPPKVIHIERCDYPFRVIQEVLRTNAVRISELDKDKAMGLLNLRLPAE
jgi:predicted nuclease of predicted toxin-antitoxin system